MSERTDSWAKGEMRLSEAIRIGAMMHEQAFGYGVGRTNNGKIVATCALGAAATTLGYKRADEEMADRFGLHEPRWHPVLKLPMAFGRVIASLNDDYRWTRNAIADWVESEELKEIERHEQAVREEHEWQRERENSIAARQHGGSVASE